MLGRAAYQSPAILSDVDATFYGDSGGRLDYAALISTMAIYAEAHIEKGGRLGHIARHMVGLFHGLPGARRYRQILSAEANRPGAGPEVVFEAFAAVDITGSQTADA